MDNQDKYSELKEPAESKQSQAYHQIKEDTLIIRTKKAP